MPPLAALARWTADDNTHYVFFTGESMMSELMVLRHVTNDSGELLYFPIKVPDNIDLVNVRYWLEKLSPGCEFRYTVFYSHQRVEYEMKLKPQEMEAVKINLDDPAIQPDATPPDY